jgi:hypothetical protein
MELHMASDFVAYDPETAKEAVEFAKVAADILAETPGLRDAMGLLGLDKLKITRLARMAELIHDANRRLEQKGIRERITPSLSLQLPLLAAAADENSEELCDVWARLLAAAQDPARANIVRRSFVEIVKQMDPLDALVFQRVDGHTSFHPNARDAWASMLQRSPDDIEVSIENLARLGCVHGKTGGFAQLPVIGLTPTGRLLKHALAD